MSGASTLPAITPYAAMQADALGAAAMDMPPMPAIPAAGAGIGAAASSPFGRLVSQGLEGINTELIAAQGGLQALAVGQAPNLHQTMMRLEESRLSFQLLLQVRNRLLEAYQDVMKMQV